jgi:hypothetical protein
MATPIPESIVGDLRGVGGLTADGQKPVSSSGTWFGSAEVLRSGTESVRGLWMRQITLENPSR